MIKPSNPTDELLIVMPDSISDVGVGRRIADLRHAAGLSQLSLGRAAGRTQNWGGPAGERTPASARPANEDGGDAHGPR
jgi:hypothetical protein